MNQLKSTLLSRFRKDSKQGFTLIEIAIVIAIITLLAVGIAQSATYFRTQANKSLCIIIQKQIQDAVRSIQNLDGVNYGGTFNTAELWVAGTAASTSAYFPTQPVCPSVGTTGALVPKAVGIVPQPNVPYVTCTYLTGAGSHAPSSYNGW